MPIEDSTPLRLCSFPDCGKKHLARGLCSAHVAQFYRGQELRICRTGGNVARFWMNVDKSGGPESCWPWKGGKDADGYGRARLGAKSRRAHRIAWELVNGPIPAEIFVLHHCDNPPCCNVERCLWLGTAKDNAADCKMKKRTASGDANGSRLHPERLAWGDANPARLHPERLARGMLNVHAILDESAIIEIRRRADNGERQWSIADSFRVSQAHISKIARRVAWAHISEVPDE